MSLSYSNASTARIISRASTFLLLIILSYDVFDSFYVAVVVVSSL